MHDLIRTCSPRCAAQSAGPFGMDSLSEPFSSVRSGTRKARARAVRFLVFAVTAAPSAVPLLDPLSFGIL